MRRDADGASTLCTYQTGFRAHNVLRSDMVSLTSCQTHIHILYFVPVYESMIVARVVEVKIVCHQYNSVTCRNLYDDNPYPKYGDRTWKLQSGMIETPKPPP